MRRKNDPPLRNDRSPQHRTFPKLERLGTQDAKAGGGLPGQPAAEFWKEWDAKKK